MTSVNLIMSHQVRLGSVGPAGACNAGLWGQGDQRDGAQLPVPAAWRLSIASFAMSAFAAKVVRTFGDSELFSWKQTAKQVLRSHWGISA